MTDIKNIYGCGTALVTPFKEGRVDYDAYMALVRRQVDAGIHFLVALGSTAETPCLDDDEKRLLLAATRKAAPDTPVMVGVGSNSLLRTTRNMDMLSDADAYLVVVPYYNRPTQQGLIEYFKAVAGHTDKPVVLYNVPSRTGTNMDTDTTLRLAEIPNIVGIKEASGDMRQIRGILAGAPSGFSVFSGTDELTVDILSAGGKGVISVVSNIVPRTMARMVTMALNSDFRAASAISRSLLPLFEACMAESNPIPVKAALVVMGLLRNELRLPLTPAQPSTYTLMSQIIDKYSKEYA